LKKDFAASEIKHVASASLMPIIKDLTFNYDTNSELGKALEQTMNLNFINSYEFMSKFTSSEKNTYSIRFYIKNKDGIKNEEIENMIQQIIDIFSVNNLKI
jgi:rubrerythrin